jgi:hypothetical protein
VQCTTATMRPTCSAPRVARERKPDVTLSTGAGDSDRGACSALHLLAPEPSPRMRWKMSFPPAGRPCEIAVDVSQHSATEPLPNRNRQETMSVLPRTAGAVHAPRGARIFRRKGRRRKAGPRRHCRRNGGWLRRALLTARMSGHEGMSRAEQRRVERRDAHGYPRPIASASDLS